MHVHRAGFAGAVVAPGGAQELFPGEGGVGTLHERLQETEFLRRQGQSLTVKGAFAVFDVQPQRADRQLTIGLRQQHGHAVAELYTVEGCKQDAARSLVECTEVAHSADVRGDKQQRPAPFFQKTEQAEAFRPGQTCVEDNQHPGGMLGDLIGVKRIVSRDTAVVGSFQRRAHAGTGGDIRVNDQNRSHRNSLLIR